MAEKIKYNIDPNLIIYKNTKYTQYAKDFLKSDYKNMSIEFDTPEDALGAQKSICDWRRRNDVYNLQIMRRDKILVLIRSNHER